MYRIHALEQGVSRHIVYSLPFFALDSAGTSNAEGARGYASFDRGHFHGCGVQGRNRRKENAKNLRNFKVF